MTKISQLLGPISEYLIITGVSVLAFLILFSIVFYSSPRKARSKLTSVFFMIFSLNILLYLVISRVGTSLLGLQNQDFLLLSFVYLFFMTILVNLNTILTMRSTISKSGKGGNLSDQFSDLKRGDTYSKIDITIILTVLLISLYFFGNGSLNSLLILIFISNLIIMSTSIFIFPAFLKLSQKFFN